MLINKSLLPNFIEIETSTLCNRRCFWCPNSVYDRGQKQKYIDKKLFNKIISELADLDFAGEISLHNYNEPLLDKNLFYFLEIIKKRLPKTKAILFSNGDFLTPIMLNKLANSGINTLFISIHDAIYNSDYKRVIDDLNNKLKLKSKLKDVSDNLGVKLSTSFKKMKIIYYIPGLTMMTSRGGIIKKYDNNSQPEFCYLPFSSCAIDFEGNLKICCEIYPTNEIHKEHGIIGNLSKQTFCQLWFSDNFNFLRNKILSNNNSNIICSHCPGYNFNIDKKRMNEWKNLLNKI